jgi:hypothetical protein
MSTTPQEIQAEARSRFHRRFRDNKNNIYMFFFAALAVMPGISFSGILGTPLSPGYLIAAYPLATIVTLLALCLTYPDRKYWYLGIIPGLITGPAMIFLPRFYILTVVLPYRNVACNMEIILPILAAWLPAWVLWYLPLKSKATRDIEEELDRLQKHV